MRNDKFKNLKEREFVGKVINAYEGNFYGWYEVEVPQLLGPGGVLKARDESNKRLVNNNSGCYYPIIPGQYVVIKFQNNDIKSAYIDRIANTFVFHNLKERPFSRYEYIVALTPGNNSIRIDDNSKLLEIKYSGGKSLIKMHSGGIDINSSNTINIKSGATINILASNGVNINEGSYSGGSNFNSKIISELVNNVDFSISPFSDNQSTLLKLDKLIQLDNITEENSVDKDKPTSDVSANKIQKPEYLKGINNTEPDGIDNICPCKNYLLILRNSDFLSDENSAEFALTKYKTFISDYHFKCKLAPPNCKQTISKISKLLFDYYTQLYSEIEKIKDEHKKSELLKKLNSAFRSDIKFVNYKIQIFEKMEKTNKKCGEVICENSDILYLHELVQLIDELKKFIQMYNDDRNKFIENRGYILSRYNLLKKTKLKVLEQINCCKNKSEILNSEKIKKLISDEKNIEIEFLKISKNYFDENINSQINNLHSKIKNKISTSKKFFDKISETKNKIKLDSEIKINKLLNEFNYTTDFCSKNKDLINSIFRDNKDEIEKVLFLSKTYLIDFENINLEKINLDEYYTCIDDEEKLKNENLELTKLISEDTKNKINKFGTELNSASDYFLSLNENILDDDFLILKNKISEFKKIGNIAHNVSKINENAKINLSAELNNLKNKIKHEIENLNSVKIKRCAKSELIKFSENVNLELSKLKNEFENLKSKILKSINSSIKNLEKINSENSGLVKLKIIELENLKNEILKIKINTNIMGDTIDQLKINSTAEFKKLKSYISNLETVNSKFITLTDKDEFSFLIENEFINRLCNLKIYLNDAFGFDVNFGLNLDLTILNGLNELLVSFSQQLGAELEELNTQPEDITGLCISTTLCPPYFGIDLGNIISGALSQIKALENIPVTELIKFLKSITIMARLLIELLKDTYKQLILINAGIKTASTISIDLSSYLTKIKKSECLINNLNIYKELVKHL